MAFGTPYTFGFAAAVCVVCSVVLTGVSVGLKDQQEANARRDLQKNILEALDLPAAKDGVRPSISGKEVDDLWNEKVELIAIKQSDGSKIDAKAADLDGNGVFENNDLVLARANAAAAQAGAGGEQSWGSYLLTPEAKTQVVPDMLGLFIRKDTGTVAVPMVGSGLWGPISGYLAFDPKLTKVQGSTFFAPKETPGLGEKITRTEFESKWIGKTIVEDGKTVPIRVPKPSECDDSSPHCVDGISGATLTSQGVDAMIINTLALYEPYIQTVR